MPHQERFYGKAFAAYRIWLLMEEVWLSMGLSTDSPSTLQPCSFPSAPGNSHSLSPNLVALAFGVPPATLAAYKTRFRAAAVASDGVASALRNPVLDVLARATLTALAHNISWFCPEKRHRKPTQVTGCPFQLLFLE
ncbi:hypothetical protein AURDEDRAFT_177825 [Auricularia subglabra TFB-10046 SS5]|uniref:Uncharacterized protein n=1 Tax=Auricularia subglabra (strain TFB-10046 / SS5) TaxID=717982 RepID=J0L9P5_AURST|nr:hypothetical protein AURDEDRAFT_177825 [Auricularia subglabra TFB-10046 SS5]